jgi:Ca-activated chloride channel homolog
MRNEDFRDDSKDAGDMGSGLTCTALYEIVPAGVDVPLQRRGDLKYQAPQRDSEAAKTGEWLTVRMRFKHPDTGAAKEIVTTMPSSGLCRQTGADFQFAAAVAAFGMILRDSPYKGESTFDKVREWACDSLGGDRNGLRSEFVGLVDRATRLQK